MIQFVELSKPLWLPILPWNFADIQTRVSYSSIIKQFSEGFFLNNPQNSGPWLNVSAKFTLFLESKVQSADIQMNNI